MLMKTFVISTTIKKYILFVHDVTTMLNHIVIHVTLRTGRDRPEQTVYERKSGSDATKRDVSSGSILFARHPPFLDITCSKIDISIFLTSMGGWLNI